MKNAAGAENNLERADGNKSFYILLNNDCRSTIRSPWKLNKNKIHFDIYEVGYVEDSSKFRVLTWSQIVSTIATFGMRK